MIRLSKSRILLHRQCPKRLWLQVHRPELADDGANTVARMAAGTEVGEVARTLHPDGLLIDGDDLSDALAHTGRALRLGNRPIFEATFEADGVLVRNDLLLPEMAGYRMVEVKSSTSVKPYHIDDAAVQTWVAGRAGVAVTRIEIAHIDNSFVYAGGGDYRGLFAHADIGAEVRSLLPAIPEWIGAARATLASDEPRIAAGAQCDDPFPCPFSGYCSPEAGDEGFPPEILPRCGALAAHLRAEGYADLRAVPEGRLTHPRHLRVWRVTRQGRPELDPKAAVALADLPYPRFHLDFETIGFAVPRWAGTRPYQQVPFQWSCHVEVQPDVVLPLAFLADRAGDPRRDFAESLLEALDPVVLAQRCAASGLPSPARGAGPIFVYNAGFERGRMLELADAFPDLAPALHAAAERLVDLLPIAREHYYHADMRGSWSIKAVLPTIAPHLAYDDLAVGDGRMAQEAYAEILDPATPAERRLHLRDALLEYCARDTWALVELVRFFEQRASRVAE